MVSDQHDKHNVDKNQCDKNKQSQNLLDMDDESKNN
jgi:hypothetical protein